MSPLCCGVVLLAIAAQVDAGAVNFRGSGQISKPEAREILAKEVIDTDHHLAQFEEALRQKFASLPKNAFGNLGHQAVRYALHRFFVDRYGWFIEGLAPVSASDLSELPTFLQTAFESQLGNQGVDLHGLATLAASLEDVADKEMRVRLGDAYEANDVISEEPASPDQVTEVLNTFLISFLISNNWTVTSAADLAWKKKVFASKYREYNRTMEWYTPIREKLFAEDASQLVSFDAVANAAMEIGKTYHSQNELGCADLRSVLNDMESRRPGRVRLSVFYNKSLHGLWDFDEKVDFLRALGALDESDPKAPSVIIPNYATSRLNCLNATTLYAICCPNICDDLITHLENAIGAPTATAERIVELVSELSSESVAAPRQLPAALIDRLHQVAAHHSGFVPLHGRLFAQWMHHAFPRECPYPHEAGIVSVQTPEEWMAQTGEATQAASPEEMRQQVEADTCAVGSQGKVECGEESADLPWTMSEQLLASDSTDPSGEPASEDANMFPMFALLCLIAAAAVLSWVGIRQLRTQQHAVMLISLLLAAAAYFGNMLDGAVFGLAVVGSLAAAGANRAAGRLRPTKGGGLPSFQAKCV